MPVTARQLETLIRISMAMAKARLSDIVETCDAEKAYDLLRNAMFRKKSKERMAAPKRGRRRDGEAAAAAGDPNASDDDEEAMEVEEVACRAHSLIPMPIAFAGVGCSARSTGARQSQVRAAAFYTRAASPVKTRLDVRRLTMMPTKDRAQNARARNRKPTSALIGTRSFLACERCRFCSVSAITPSKTICAKRSIVSRIRTA